MVALVVWVEPITVDMYVDVPLDSWNLSSKRINEMKSNTVIDHFLEMMSAERGACEHTLAAYQRDLQWAQDELFSHSVSLFSAQREDLIGLLSLMHTLGFAASSQARRLSTLRQFYQFLYAEGLRADDPSHNIDAPRQGVLCLKLLVRMW